MFGKYKQSITNILVSAYTNKKTFKKHFHNLMHGLRENKTAREFFVLYGEIENKQFNDKNLAEEYLNEVVKTLKSKKKTLRIPIIKEQANDALCVTGSPASGKGKGKWLGVGKMTDRDSLGNVKVGTEVRVDNGIPTKISKIWYDSEKRPSAFQFEDKNISIGGLNDKGRKYIQYTPSVKDATEGQYYQNPTTKQKYQFKGGKYIELKAGGGKRKLCFGVAGSKTSGFVNKTASYKAVTHTMEDIKSGKATLGIGDKGEIVKEVQKLVGAKPDGYFGPKTLAKVKAFQKSKNFAVTGKIDKETLGGGSPDVEGPTWEGKGGSAKNPIQGVWSVKDPDIKKGMHFQNTQTKQIYKFDGKKYVELTDALAENHNNIYSQLDSLIFNNSVKSIEKNLRNKGSLIEHLTRENKDSKINGLGVTSIFSEIATKKFNNKYDILSTEDKENFKKYLQLDKTTLKEEFNTSQKEVLNKLETLKESSKDQKVLGKLDSAINQLNNSKSNRVSLYKLNKLKKELN